MSTDNHKIGTLITDICSIIIAVAAVYIAYSQGSENRKHNKLSVKPILQLNKEYVGSPSDLQPFLSISLNNVGVGPAIIKSILVQYDNDELTPLSLERWESIFKNISGNKLVPHVLFIDPDEALGAGLEKNIITVKFENKNVIPGDILNKINMIIEYESVYEEKLPPVSLHKH